MRRTGVKCFQITGGQSIKALTFLQPSCVLGSVRVLHVPYPRRVDVSQPVSKLLQDGGCYSEILSLDHLVSGKKVDTTLYGLWIGCIYIEEAC